MTTPDPGPFRVAGERRGATALVVPAGEIDIATAPRLAEEIQRVRAGAGLERLVVDLRHVEFMDSVSIELLLRLHADLEAAGGELVLVRGPRAVDRLFRVMELDSVLVVVDEPPLAGA